MDTGLFAAYRSGDVKLAETGLLKAWISLLSDYDTLQEPVIGETPALGDAYKIGTADVWTTGKEAIPIYIFPDSLEAPAASQGTKGSFRLVHTPKIFIIGDGPEILEMINNWLNSALIIYVQDQCNPSQLIRYGCDCLWASVSKQDFSTGTLKSGQKGYSMEIEAYCKYFYNAALSERA